MRMRSEQVLRLTIFRLLNHKVGGVTSICDRQAISKKSSRRSKFGAATSIKS